MLEKMIKEWSIGSHIDMKSASIFPGEKPFITIGYKYRYQKVLGFIYMKEAISTVLGDRYSLFILLL